jgi:predicted HTH transcriptional regulator
MESPWEDYLLERKVESDLKDLLKTLVAFANSVRPGHVARILIGERDGGMAAGVTNPDNIQQSVRKEAEKIYPPIIWRSNVYEKDGQYCVKVEIEYSGNTPHWVAWVRRGSSTIEASEEVFQRLIDLRLELVRELSEWINKSVTVNGDSSTVPPDRESKLFRMGEHFSHRWDWNDEAKLIFVNRFWVTLENTDGKKKSEPLEKLTLSYDDEAQRLKIIVSY